MLLWVDIETTGLNAHADEIVEVGWTVTDNGCTSPMSQMIRSAVVTPTRETFELLKASEYVTNMHQKSGLLDTMLASDGTISLSEIEDLIIENVDLALNSLKEASVELIAEGNLDQDAFDREIELRVAGNSVHFDKGFIEVHMPRLAKKLSHRILDVTTLKHFFQGYVHPCEYVNENPHRAGSDVAESLETSRHYVRAMDQMQELATNQVMAQHVMGRLFGHSHDEEQS